MGPGGGVTRAQEGMTGKKALLPPLPSREGQGQWANSSDTAQGLAPPAQRSGVCVLSLLKPVGIAASGVTG